MQFWDKSDFKREWNDTRQAWPENCSWWCQYCLCNVCAPRDQKYNEIPSHGGEQQSNLWPAALLLWSAAPHFWEWKPWRRGGRWKESLGQQPQPGTGTGAAQCWEESPRNKGTTMCLCHHIRTSIPAALPPRMALRHCHQSTRNTRVFLSARKEWNRVEMVVGLWRGLVSRSAFGMLLEAQHMLPARMGCQLTAFVPPCGVHTTSPHDVLRWDQSPRHTSQCSKAVLGCGIMHAAFVAGRDLGRSWTGLGPLGWLTLHKRNDQSLPHSHYHLCCISASCEQRNSSYFCTMSPKFRLIASKFWIPLWNWRTSCTLHMTHRSSWRSSEYVWLLDCLYYYINNTINIIHCLTRVSSIIKILLEGLKQFKLQIASREW